MKKRVCFLTSLLLVFALVVQSGFFVKPSTAMVMPEKYKVDNEEIALQDIKQNHDMQVFTLGDVKIPQSLSKELLITKISPNDLGKDSFNAKVRKKIKTMVISEDKAKSYLDKEEFKKIEQLLGEGLSVYFVGKNDMNKFFDLTNNNPNKKAHITEEIKNKKLPPGKDTSSQIQENANILGYMWVTKNAKGEYLVGTGHFDSSFSQEDIAEKIIYGAWHRQEDYKFTDVMPQTEVKSQLAQKFVSIAEAESLSDFTVGPGWQTWGWQRHDFYSAYGDLSIWKTFADLWFNGTTPYLAFVGQAYLDPADGYQNWGLYYGGDIDYYTAYPNLLYQYGPSVSPNTTTWSYGIGANLSGTVSGTSGLSGSVGAAWSIGVTDDDCDIWLQDDTSMTNDDCWVWIGYKDYDATWPMPNREYVIQTSRQDFTIISQAYRDSNGVTQIPIYHKAWFYQQFDNDQSPNSSCGEYWGWTLTYYPN